MKIRLLKLSSLFLALTIVLSLFCAASLTSNAETNVIYVDQTGATNGASTTLKDAVDKAKADTTINTIMFKSDYTTTSSVSVGTKNITIDLGGYTFTVAGTGQGMSIGTTGVVVQNGKVVLNAEKCNTNAYYGIYNAASGNKLTVKNIEFEFVTAKGSNGTVYDGAGATTPGAVLRNVTGTNSIINAYDCSFVYNGTYDYKAAPLAACNTATMNLYNCTFDGNGKMSGVQVRGNENSQSQYAQLGIHNCTFNNIKNLFGLSTNSGVKDPTTKIPLITIYGMTVNNATNLKARDEYPMSITAAEHATMPDLTTLTSPYIFEVTCAHSFVDGVCEYCYAPEPTAPSVPAITMDSGAAMRIDSKTEGIRFSATVNKTELDGFGYEVTDAGMLVAKESIASTETLTVENSVPVTSAGQTIADGKVVAARYNGVTLKTADDANKYVIFGSLVEISEKNANQKYVARAFIEYTDGEGNTAYLYSDLSDARSIAEVASLIQQDGLAKPDDDTVYYNTLCGTHKDLIDFWAGKYSN